MEKLKTKTNFLDKIDLSKKYPDHIDKRIIRVGFVFVLIIQMIALTMTGFNFNPAWAECQEDLCENPFYEATGKVCEINYPLCDQATLTKGEVLGTKPPLFALYANSISWTILFITAIANYEICKKRRLKNGKRI